MALRCIKAFSAFPGGRPRVVKAGALVQEDDPIVKGREAHFESVDQHLARRTRGVEQATAGPGERRDLAPPTALFNPAEHKASEVIEYLKTADEDERERVLAAEAAGKKRTTILDGTE